MSMSLERGISDDQLLRNAGFVIRSRRVGEEPIWERKRRLYKQSMALLIVSRERSQVKRVNK